MDQNRHTGDRGSPGFDDPRDDQAARDGSKPINFGDQRDSAAGEGRGDDYVGAVNRGSGGSRAARADVEHAGSPSRYGSDLPSSTATALRAEEDEFDPEYLQWRNEQMRRLDDDYRSWRSQHHENHAAEFGDWCNRRSATDRAVMMGNPGHVEPGHGGASEGSGNPPTPPRK